MKKIFGILISGIFVVTPLVTATSTTYNESPVLTQEATSSQNTFYSVCLGKTWIHGGFDRSCDAEAL